jgi:hypothetical protein
MKSVRKSWHDTAAGIAVAILLANLALGAVAYFVAPWLIAAWFVSGLFR